MGKAVQDPEAKGKCRPANPAPSRPIKHPNSLSLSLSSSPRFLPIPLECENLFPFPRPLFAIALRPRSPIAAPLVGRSVRPPASGRQGGAPTERGPLSSFVELISPAAKIAACHSGIGVQLIRLTL